MEDQNNNNQEEEDDDELTKQLIIDEENNKANNKSNISQELSIENLPEDLNNYDISIKLIILGDSNVGKSSIVNCLQQDSNLQRKTISLEHYNYIIKINNIITRMQIWDTVGQEKFDSITTNYYKITDVAIFVYAINDIDSFNNINHWDTELNDKGNISLKSSIVKNNKIMLKVLVGNKKDLENERKVAFEQGEKLYNKNFDFFMEINCNYYKDGVFDESSYSGNKENQNENEEKEKETDSNEEKDSKDDKDCVKILFDKIGRMIYKKYINEYKENSSVYNYEASPSILEEDKAKKGKNKNNKCCC